MPKHSEILNLTHHPRTHPKRNTQTHKTPFLQQQESQLSTGPGPSTITRST